MENIKLYFEADQAEILSGFDSERFSIMRLKCFASGENAHNLGLSDEVLKQAENSIFNVPIVWFYDPMLDDAEGHNELEVPCGFVPQDSPISYERLDDGRLMMIVEQAVVWKKYSGRLMKIFSRDDGKKSLSVEISVKDFYHYEGQEEEYEILDFQYEAITLLGDFYQPAIKGAEAEVIRFTKDYFEDYKREFLFSNDKYSNINFSIPNETLDNIKMGIEMMEEKGLEIGNVIMGYSRYLSENQKITPKKVNYIKGHLEKRQDLTDNVGMCEYLLLGGKFTQDWLSSIVEEMVKEERKITSYFNLYEGIKTSSLYDISIRSSDEMNDNKQEDIVTEEEVTFEEENLPAEEVQATDESVTEEVVQEEEFEAQKGAEQDEDVAMQEEDEEEDEEEDDGEDVEMSEPEEDFSFNSTQMLQLLNRTMSETKTSIEGYGEYQRYYVESYDESFAYVYDYEEDKMFRCKYTIANNEALVDMESKQEVIRGNYIAIGDKEKADFSLNAYLDVGAILALLQKEEENFMEISSEVVSEQFGTFLGLMETALKKMSEKVEVLAEFKANIEQAEFDHEVETTILEVQEFLSQEEIANAKEKAQEFTIETIDGWKNLVKAVAFANSKDSITKPEQPFKRMSLPFNNQNGKKKDTLWN